MMKVITTIFLFLLFNFSYSQIWLQNGGSSTHDEAFDVEIDGAGNIFSVGYVSSTSLFGTTLNAQSNGFSDIYVSKSNPNGDFIWVNTFGGTSVDRGYDIAIDNLGNSYVTGYVTGTVEFGSITITTAGGSQDFFVCKLDPNGNVIWVNVEGGSNGETGFGIEVDSDYNVVVTGQFQGLSQIGNLSVTSTTNPDTNTPSSDLFIVKYDVDGNPLWTKTGIAPYDDKGVALDINPNNEIVVVGQFSDTLTIGTDTYNNSVLNAGFLLKLDANGNNLWFRSMSAFQVLTTDVEADEDRIYITGDFIGQLAIFGDDITFISSSPYDYNVYLVRFDENGEIVWSEVDGSDSRISSKAITVDENRDVYFSGIFKCTFDEYVDFLGETGFFNSVGFNDVFITKYAQEGSREWMKQYGGPLDDFCSGIAMSAIDDPVIVGSYQDLFSIPYNSSPVILNDNNYVVSEFDCNANLINHIINQSIGFKDIFITKPVNLDLVDYFYYTQSCYDYIIPEAIDLPDLNCGYAELGVNTFTYGNGYTAQDTIFNFGPYFTYEWNIGSNDSIISVYDTGWYTCQIDRLDDCKQTLDSIYVEILPIPEIPPMTDNIGFNSNETMYNDIAYCFPDTAWVTFDVDTNLITTFEFTQTIINPFDTITLESPGYHYVSVESAAGCFNEELFIFTIDYPLLDTMVPFLVHPSGLDSIIICEDQPVVLYIIDSLTNPILDPSIPFETYVYPSGIFQELDYGFFVQENGWHNFTLDPVILGVTNTCGVDTNHYAVSTDLYIEIRPMPETPQLLGNSPFCPGDTVNIWTDIYYPSFNWSGPGIVSMNEAGDSIFAIEEGDYHYSGYLVDSTGLCSKYHNIQYDLEFFDDPTIWSNVPDNLICPGDSLLLTCDPGLEYTWINPFGQIIGSEQTVWVDIPGYYHCVLLNYEGCLLTSNSLELLEYNSPFLFPEPDTEICIFGSTDVTILHSGSPDFSWLAPINSSSPEITLTEAGVYYVEITQCGFTLTDSVTITDSGFEAIITSTTSLYCGIEENTLTAFPENMASYEWSTGVDILQSQITINESGLYSVLVTDSIGCFSSATLNVEYHDYPEPPTVDGDLIYCVGEEIQVTFSDYADNDFNEFIWTYYGEEINTPSIIDTSASESFTLGTYYFDGFCDTISSVDIIVNPNPVITLVSNNGPLCYGDNLVAHSSSTTEVDYLWTGPDNFSSTDASYNIFDVTLDQGGTYELEITNEFGCTDNSEFSIDVFLYPVIDLGPDTIICPGRPVTLDVVTYYHEYLWSTGETTTEITVDNPGIYTVEVAHEICWITEEIEIIPDCDPIYFPNIFTPNGDGLNDYLTFNSLRVKNIEVLIFNRWGNLVGEWTDVGGYWDGTHYETGAELAEGVYYYVVKFTNYLNEEHDKSSYITLIRD